MRKQVASDLLSAPDDDLLTTGEAADLLGVSRQHVVDLCDRGDLLYSWSGKHRRIRRGDAALVATGTRRVTRDQVRSLLLALVVAGHIVVDPDGTRALAKANLRKVRDSSARGAARVWTEEWERLLEAPLIDLLAALTSHSARGRELRQNSPFAGVLSDEERRLVADTARSVSIR